MHTKRFCSKVKPECCHSYPLVQNSDMWPHVGAKKTGKCSLYSRQPRKVTLLWKKGSLHMEGQLVVLCSASSDNHCNPSYLGSLHSLSEFTGLPDMRGSSRKYPRFIPRLLRPTGHDMSHQMGKLQAFPQNSIAPLYHLPLRFLTLYLLFLQLERHQV